MNTQIVAGILAARNSGRHLEPTGTGGWVLLDYVVAVLFLVVLAAIINRLARRRGSRD